MYFFTSVYVLNCTYFSPQILPALCVLIHHTDVNVSKFSLYNYMYMCRYACTGLPYDIGEQCVLGFAHTLLFQELSCVCYVSFITN